MNTQVYLDRQNLLRQRMEREGLSVFLVTHLPNIRYICGFSGSHAALLVVQEECSIISDGRYQEQIGQEVVGATLVPQGQRKDSTAIAETLADMPPGKAGFESDHFFVARHTTLSEVCTERQLVATVGWVEELRAAKDDGEIHLIRQSLRIAEKAFERTLHDIREGMTERELAHQLEEFMWQEGAEKDAFETLVLFGPRSSLPHGKPSNATLNAGTPILMDFGCVWRGYCSDITRTIFLGEPGKEFREAYRAVHDAYQAAVEAIRPDLLCRAADATARSVLEEAGRRDQFIHSLGHGVGLEIHEAPRLSATEEEPLREGMVITVEPGVYVPGWGGIRIENMVIVRGDGPEILNRTSTEMITL